MERIGRIQRFGIGKYPDSAHVTVYLAATGLQGDTCGFGHGLHVLMVYNVAAAYAVQVVLSRADTGNQTPPAELRYAITDAWIE